MRGRLENQTSQGAAIEQRIAQGEAESAELATRLARLEAEREAHRISVAKLDRETELARQRVMERNNAREELQRQIRERERELEAGRLAVLRLPREAFKEASERIANRLLKEMSQETQFIVITHSRKTMEATEAMYGVTMPEPGVSKLVSARLAAT